MLERKGQDSSDKMGDARRRCHLRRRKERRRHSGEGTSET